MSQSQGALSQCTAPEEMVKDLKVKVFAEREMKFLTKGAEGRETGLL